ncbi:MAG: type II toxin-antitoxin system prevent-host-death family antitoxin [Nitratireductor sp.]|nr:type II toxin-antitoxin system prevent-host-death family antitoxin [Nitratireductor sp.]
MRHFTATEAKNRFGELLELSSSEPVAISKSGRNIRVVLSVEEYERLLKSGNVESGVQTSLERSMKRWHKVYEALAR